jgi:ABC-type multidrug transport system ATPase subunit
MSNAISISALNKIYGNGLKALAGIDLEIRRSEIFALSVVRVFETLNWLK